MKKDQEKWNALVKKFEVNRNEDGLVLIHAALLAGCSYEMIEKYMKESLPSDMLMEMLLSIVDGVSENYLKLYIENSDNISVEEMRNIRLSTRSDKIIEGIAENIRRTTEIIENANIPALVSELKKLTKNGTDFSGESSEKNESPNNQNIETEATNVDDEKDRQISEMASNEGYNHEKCDYMIVKDGEVIQCENTNNKPNMKKKILSFFKKSNKDKIIEQEKRSILLQEFIRAGCRGEKLKAFTEAIRLGVSAEFLRIYIDRDISADELRLYTAGYLAIYDPNTEYRYGSEGE